MIGEKESRVTYPEFYRLPNGDLLFLYRHGSSGQGDVMMNHYCVRTKIWTRRQDGFIHGEGERNAYWQMAVDARGVLHLSWVWRETGNVATNHDMAYAKSEDGGKTRLKTSGERYKLPITAANTEYAARIPQNHELINTAGICADGRGRPCIATYWRPVDSKVPQYHLIYHDGATWQTSQIGQRTTAFSLSGGGTKRLSMSRPRVLADDHGGTHRIYMLFRDVERGDHVSVAICDDPANPEWRFKNLTDFDVGMWEPSFDTELWKREGNTRDARNTINRGAARFRIFDLPLKCGAIFHILANPAAFGSLWHTVDCRRIPVKYGFSSFMLVSPKMEPTLLRLLRVFKKTVPLLRPADRKLPPEDQRPAVGPHRHPRRCAAGRLP